MYWDSIYPLINTNYKRNKSYISFFGIVIIGIVISVNPVYAKEYTKKDLWNSPELIKDLLQSRELYPEDVPNPHWRDGACTACHTGTSNFNKSNLRSNNSDKICANCHNSLSIPDYSHPSDTKLTPAYWDRIPTKFKRSLKTSLGKKSKTMSCRTCHDLPMQCLRTRRSEEPENTNFLRLGPYLKRTDMCFFCHNRDFFKRLTPHKQVVAGEVNKESCKICHINTEKLNSRTKLRDAKFPEQVDLSELCTNCHPWRPHPGWEFSFSKKKAPNHLVKPSREMRQRMKEMQKKTGVILPVARSSGKIHCGTCHNPHQKGVIKSTQLNSGADSRKKMRLKKSCSYCHDT